MAADFSCPPLSNVGIVAVCFLHWFAACVCSLLTKDIIRSPAVQEYTENLPLKLPPDTWWAAGNGFGCLIGIGFLIWCGRKSTLQILGSPLLLLSYSALYYLPKIEFEHDNFSNSVWTFGFTVCLFLQGAGDTVSQLGLAVYLLETVCFRSKRTIVILLFATRLPSALAPAIYSVFNTQVLRVLPMAGLVATIALYFALPESPAWLLVSKGEMDKATRAMSSLTRRRPLTQEEEASVLASQLQKQPQETEKEAVLRPFLVCCGVLLLSLFSGEEIYRFYANWSFRHAGLEVRADTVLSWSRAGAVLLSGCLSWTSGAAGLGLVVWTGAAMTCLFAGGSLLQGLEGGAAVQWWLPVGLEISHSVAQAAGPLALALPVALHVAPARTPPVRAASLGLALLLYRGVARLNASVLPLLIETLHPFGVFWLEAGLSALGLVYLATVAVPELKHATKLSRKRLPQLDDLRLAAISQA